MSVTALHPATSRFLVAIDPGPEQSAILVYDPDNRRPVWWAIESNEQVLERLDDASERRLVIEKVESFGMAVGAETFETVHWSGRFHERWVAGPFSRREPERIGRRAVKLHICGSARAKDANIRTALIDRWGGSKNVAVGRKATPGPLYGISSHGWAALALAVTAAEVFA